MKKFILCFLLILLVSPVKAGFLMGTYKQLAHKCYKTADGLWKCESEDWIDVSVEDLCPRIKLGTAVEQGRFPLIDFRIFDYYAKTSLGKVLNNITTIEAYGGEGERYERACSFTLYFSDGEAFTCDGYLVDSRKKYYRGRDVGSAWLYTNIGKLHSNRINLNILSDESKITYITKKLSTKKIEKITFAGLSLNLESVLTEDIFSVFFTELYKKTGYTYLYHVEE